MRGWSRSPTTWPSSSASTARSSRRYSDLFERTIGVRRRRRRVRASRSFGLYRHWMRYATQRDYLQIAQACVVATLVAARLRGHVQPLLSSTAPTALHRRSTSRPSVLVLYGLLMLVFIGGSRFLVHLLYERPLSGFRARRDARSVADRRRRRRRPAAAARDHAQPRPRLPARRVRRRRPAQAGRADRPRAVRARHDRASWPRCSRRRARRGADRDPVRAGHGARAGRRRLPRPRRPGAHDADRLRAAAARRPAACGRSARSRSRTSSAASRCGWTSTASAAT